VRREVGNHVVEAEVRPASAQEIEDVLAKVVLCVSGHT
jgi:hypothetical protein